VDAEGTISLWLANLVALTHGALVVFQVISAMAAAAGVLRRHPCWERFYYALVAGIIASDLLIGECILTRWEKALRNRDLPGSAYRGSFIGHYAPWLPPVLLTWLVPALIVVGVLAFPVWRWVDYRRTAARW
jgi:hypothetical protein